MDSDEDHFATTFKDLPVEIKTIITTKGYDFQAIERFAQTSKENLEITKNAFKRDNMCTQAIKRNYGAFKALCTNELIYTRPQKNNILQPCTEKDKLLERVCPETKEEWDDWHISQLHKIAGHFDVTPSSALFFIDDNNFYHPLQWVIQKLIDNSHSEDPDELWKGVTIIKLLTPDHRYNFGDNRYYYLGKYSHEPKWFREYKRLMLKIWEHGGDKEGFKNELKESISLEIIEDILEEDPEFNGQSVYEYTRGEVQEELNKVWWKRVEPLFNTKKCNSASCQNRLPDDSWEDYCQTCLENPDQLD